ncbi:hypothetical protein X975_20217, partial [Stegodyphus mimosarum]
MKKRGGRTITYINGIIVFLFYLQILSCQGFEKIITEADALSLRPGRLFVQVVTEPRSLIRLFEGLNLSFQMLRHWGRTGSALIRLPFDPTIMPHGREHPWLEVWKKPNYARMPTRFIAEAPRYIKLPKKESGERKFFNSF